MEDQASNELKNKIESILFSAGKRIELADIAKLCNLSHRVDIVQKALEDLKEKYSEGPIMLVQDGSAWKMTVRERYASVVQKIVTRAELTKTLMETLAVIAYKAPVLQSDVIKIRTNKAYDHLAELEKQGYILREKHGRTKMIRLTPKFYEYFDIPPEKVKEKFKQIEEMEKAVAIKEAEAKELKSMKKEKEAEHKEKSDTEKKTAEEELKKVEVEIVEKESKLPEIDLVDDEGHKEKLDVYDSEVAEGTELEEPKANITIVKDKLGELDVVHPGLSEAEKKVIIEKAQNLRKADEQWEKDKKAKADEAKKFKDKFSLKVGEEGEKEEAEEEPEEAPAEEAAEEEDGEEGEAEEGAEGEEKEEAEEEAPAEEEKEGGDEAGEEAKAEAEAGQKPEEAKQKEEEKHLAHDADQIAKEAKAAAQKKPIKMKEGKKLFHKGMSKEVEQKIDSRVEEIVYGKKTEGAGEEGKKEGKEGEEEKKKETREDY